MKFKNIMRILAKLFTQRIKRKHQVARFSFCETISATGTSPWHIRQLTDKGLKLGGGADSKSLCGREVAWDLEVEITRHHLIYNSCRRCFQRYQGD